MKRTIFDSDCKLELQKAIRKALEPLTKQTNIGFVVNEPFIKKGRFVTEISATPLNKRQKSEQTQWKLLYQEYGFQLDDWGSIFTCNSKKFKVWNILPSHPKPIAARCKGVKNKLFHFAVDYVHSALAKSKISKYNNTCGKCGEKWKYSVSGMINEDSCADKFDPSKIFYKQPNETWLCHFCDLDRIWQSSKKTRSPAIDDEPVGFTSLFNKNTE
jgi:hypothetical protein